MDDIKVESVQYVKLATILQKEVLRDRDIWEIGDILRNSLRGMIDYLLDATIDEIKSSNHYVEALRAIVKGLRVVYNNTGTDTGASDSEYDILAEKLELVDDLENDIEDSVHYKNKGYHLYPSLRGTLDKVYYLSNQDKGDATRRSLDDWIRSSRSKLADRPDLSKDIDSADIYLFPKWDGVSVIFEMSENDTLERALTRGYTALNEACIVTNTFRSMLDDEGRLPFNSYPLKSPHGKYGIKTEAMTSDESLAKYNQAHPDKPYKNTRSFASAIINNEVNDPALSQELRIIPLRYCVDDKQYVHPDAFTYPYLECRLDEITKIREFAEEHHSIHTYEGETLRCDGAVIYLKNMEYHDALGRENDREKAEVAYKFTEEYAYPKVLDIKYTVGLYGTITPILQLVPTVMKGNLVSNVSLGSIGKLNEMKLGKKDTVKIGYDIIPVCSFDIHDPKCIHSSSPRFVPPDKCPSCGQPLQYTDATACCKSPKCPSRMMGRIKNHIVRLRIRDIGDSLIEQMYYAGICKTIPDLYKLRDRKEKMLELPGMGKKKYNNIIRQIDEVQDREIDEARLLSSLSMERLSYATFRRILSVYTLDELLEISDNAEYEKLESIGGIGSTTARWIIMGLTNKTNRKNLAFLQGALTVCEVGKGAPRYTLCFSSFEVGDPKVHQVEDLVMDQGGAVVESITRETTYLIIPDKRVNSNKVKKATKYGIPIFTADEFIQRSIPQD